MEKDVAVYCIRLVTFSNPQSQSGTRRDRAGPGMEQQIGNDHDGQDADKGDGRGIGGPFSSNRGEPHPAQARGRRGDRRRPPAPAQAGPSS